MPWTIKQINNAKKEYFLERHTGEIIKISVPKEHRDVVLSSAYVAAVRDAHELVLSASVKTPLLMCVGCASIAAINLIVPVATAPVSCVLLLVSLIRAYGLIKYRK